MKTTNILCGLILCLNMSAQSNVVDASFEIQFASMPISETDIAKPLKWRKQAGIIRFEKPTGNWQIEFPTVANARRIHHYDGTNIYTYTIILESDGSLSGRYGGSIQIAAASTEGGPIGVEIEPGCLILSSSLDNIAWFAWCSGEFLRKPGRILPDLATKVREDPMAYGFKDTVKQSQDWLGAPLEMIQTYNYDLLYQSPYNAKMPREGLGAEKYSLGDLKLRVKDGSRRAEFKVIKSSEILGAKWPAEFEYLVYHPSTDGSLNKAATMVGKLLSISYASKLDVPQVVKSHQNFGVIDHRFRHPSKTVDLISYSQTNHEILPINSQRLHLIFERSSKEASWDIPHQRKYGLMFLKFTIVSVSVVIVGIWLLKMCRKWAG